MINPPKSRRRFTRFVLSLPFIGRLLHAIDRGRRLNQRETDIETWNQCGKEKEGDQTSGEFMSYGQHISGCDYLLLLAVMAAICAFYCLLR